MAVPSAAKWRSTLVAIPALCGALCAQSSVDVRTIEAESLLPAVTATARVVAQSDCCGLSWSGKAQLLFRANTSGDVATLKLRVPRDGQYDLSAVITQAPEYGIVRFAADGVAVGQIVDGYHDRPRLRRRVPLGSVAWTAGVHQLSLAVVGKHDRSVGYHVGIDTITFDRRDELPVVASRPYSTLAETPTAGRFVRIFDPSVGESGPWYYNDHTLVLDRISGTWHVFAITHAEPPNPLDERHFGHATAPSLHGPWTKQPHALTAELDAGERHVWAPHVVWHDNTYYMFYAAGTSDPTRYRMHLATSRDLWEWKRSAANPLFYTGWEGRDPMVIRVGDQWVMYYTATTTPTGGNHVVAYRTSSDLVTWGEERIAFKHPARGTFGGPTESPFVLYRNEWWYLFVCCERSYVSTAVYRSRDPFHFEYGHRVGDFLPAHAAEVVHDEAGNSYVTHAGWQQGGLWLAPLHWTAGEVARGHEVATPYYRARVQTWPDARLEALDVDPLGRGRYRRAHDVSSLGTAPLLAVGPTNARDFAGAPSQVDLSPDHTRLHLLDVGFGPHPVRADWLLTFLPTAVQSDVCFRVASPVLDLREVGVSIDTSLPCIGDGIAPCRDGDAGGFGAWTLASDTALSMVAAYRAGSAWRAENRRFDAPHGAVAWQALRQFGGTAWPTGIYPGGTWRMAASARQNDVEFAESFANALNTVR